MNDTHILIPVAPGELIDKITILEIKQQEISNEEKLKNVKTELETLQKVMTDKIQLSDELMKLHEELRAINKKIWDTENDVREFWDDDILFNKAARGSHHQNDERARVKKEINYLLGSDIQEVKEHPKYEHKG